MSPVRNFAIAVVVLAFAVASASAQPIISAKSGMIAGIEGKVLLDNQEVEQSVTHFPEVKEGSVLRTEDGRVEVMLPPGFMLRMGENGSLKMLANRLVDTRVEMLAGSAVVEVDQVSQDFNVSVALKDGVVTLSKVGVYRLDCDPPRIKVFRGSATVQIAGETVMVGTGKMLALAGESATAEKFDLEQTDALDNWSRRRAEAMALANVSGAQYNGSNYPAQGQGNGGSWRYNPYFDMYTYIPMNGRMCNPYYGICYYSPSAAYQTFVARPVYNPPAGFGGGAGSPTYAQTSGTSTGAATSVASAPAMSSSPAAAASSSTAAAASSASSGHGSAGASGHK
jgi:FecR protein